MNRSEKKQETVFADLKTGDEFQLAPNGATFEKKSRGRALLTKTISAEQKVWEGSTFHFGLQTPVTPVEQ
jgi:hypothetical protein